jgi:hypothetical protein
MGAIAAALAPKPVLDGNELGRTYFRHFLERVADA